MDVRQAARENLAGRPAERMRRLNARHPWNHNDAFHSWILTRLPDQRGSAVDVGCGRGELLAVLSPYFDHGIDKDDAMRRAASARCAGQPNVLVDEIPLDDLPTASADLLTMVAVLHHLDLEAALAQVRRILRPGGRFLCVGLATPTTIEDRLWDVASIVTNPLIGWVRHPWVAHSPSPVPGPPVAEPQYTYAQIECALGRQLPGARLRHRLGFRHTIEWEKDARTR